MMNSKVHVTVLLGAAALFLGSANAHGYLGLPVVTFPSSVDKTQFVATIASSASGFSGSFGGSPADNAAAFWTAFQSSKYSSIKEFVTDLGQIVANGANIECGLTDPNETPRPLPDELEWTHSDSEGFSSSHEGPCEAWCDDIQVFQDTNCAAHFTTAPAKMPYDKASCSGASRLTFYWLALHTPTWQVYANCAALEGGSGSHPSQSNSTSSGSTEQSNTPMVATAMPMTITVTPVTTTATPTVATFTPTFTTAPTSVAGCGDEILLDIAGSDQEGEDCGSLDVAGGDNNEVAGDVNPVGEDCGPVDIAGSLDDEDCGILDIAVSALDENIAVSESSLKFDDVGGSYVSGKVQTPYQK